MAEAELVSIEPIEHLDLKSQTYRILRQMILKREFQGAHHEPSELEHADHRCRAEADAVVLSYLGQQERGGRENHGAEPDRQQHTHRHGRPQQENQPDRNLHDGTLSVERAGGGQAGVVGLIDAQLVGRGRSKVVGEARSVGRQ